nr:MAG TPA: hypothetical protein [Caudoviricetes sp.]
MPFLFPPSFSSIIYPKYTIFNKKEQPEDCSQKKTLGEIFKK